MISPFQYVSCWYIEWLQISLTYFLLSYQFAEIIDNFYKCFLAKLELSYVYYIA